MVNKFHRLVVIFKDKDELKHIKKIAIEFDVSVSEFMRKAAQQMMQKTTEEIQEIMQR